MLNLILWNSQITEVAKKYVLHLARFTCICSTLFRTFPLLVFCDEIFLIWNALSKLSVLVCLFEKLFKVFTRYDQRCMILLCSMDSTNTKKDQLFIMYCIFDIKDNISSSNHLYLLFSDHRLPNLDVIISYQKITGYSLFVDHSIFL